MIESSDSAVRNKEIQEIITTIGERLKYIYAGTLKELSMEQVYPFWNGVYHTYFEKVFTIQQFFDALWNGTLEPPFYNVFSILNGLEFYLIDKKIDPSKFVEKILPSLSNGLIVSSERVLLLSNPYLAEFFDSKDLHGTILKVFSNLALSSELQRETCHRLVDHRIEGKCGIAIMMYNFYDDPPQGSPNGRFPAYDFELWTGSQIQSVAGFFNLPPFDELNMIADYRLITDIISPSRVEFKNDQVYLDGKLFGRMISLYERFYDQKDVIKKAKIQDCRVLLAEHDYFCHVRNRITIHKGCVYGAPLYMYELRYCHQFERPANFLSTVISALQEQRSELWLSLKQKHTTLLSKALLKLEILYNRQDESISINGVHFISGVPAKIFKKMLSIYSENRRTEFQYREFTKDSSIVNDPLNPNFVVRLTRLTKALENSYPELHIVKIAPGRLKLAISCALSYSEE